MVSRNRNRDGNINGAGVAAMTKGLATETVSARITEKNSKRNNNGTGKKKSNSLVNGNRNRSGNINGARVTVAVMANKPVTATLTGKGGQGNGSSLIKGDNDYSRNGQTYGKGSGNISSGKGLR